MKEYIKIVVVGDAGVGKTSFINYFIDGEYKIPENKTIGVDFASKEIKVNNKDYALQISEIGGENQFLRLLDIFLKGVEGALLLYEPAKFRTFVNLTWWIQNLRQSRPEIRIILVANKSDQVQNWGSIELKQRNILRKYELDGTMIISSINGENVNECFEKLAEIIVSAR